MKQGDKNNKSLPAFVVEYTACGDWLNGDEVCLRRSNAIAQGYSYLVAIPLKEVCRGVHDGGAYLEKYFAKLADAKIFIHSYRESTPIPWARINYMLDNGRGAKLRYKALQYVGCYDFIEPARTMFFE